MLSIETRVNLSLQPVLYLPRERKVAKLPRRSGSIGLLLLLLLLCRAAGAPAKPTKVSLCREKREKRERSARTKLARNGDSGIFNRKGELDSA